MIDKFKLFHVRAMLTSPHFENTAESVDELFSRVNLPWSKEIMNLYEIKLAEFPELKNMPSYNLVEEMSHREAAKPSRPAKGVAEKTSKTNKKSKLRCVMQGLLDI